MNATANATIEIDEAGRLEIPQDIRDALHLAPGTRVVIHQDGDTLVVRPEPPRGRLVEKNGRLVWRSGTPATFDIVEEIEKMRKERDQAVVGDWIKL